MIELNKIYNEDCLKTIDRIDNNLLDLVITSPPYNINLGRNKYNNNPYDLYNDNKDYGSYIQWLENIFSKLYPKLKCGGRVCINIGDGKNGRIPTHSDITQFMTKSLRYLPFAHIIWHKSQVSNRCSWGSFQSPSCPSFPTPFEHILVFSKSSRKLQYKGQSDLTKQEFIEWSLALWNFTPETNSSHPAPFPVELPRRLIKMLSWVDAVVYDPFMGSGTTAVACKQTNRNYIGSEISPEYCKMAEERLKEVQLNLPGV